MASPLRAGGWGVSAPSRRLLVVTDNRFWLDRMGSNARILAMLQFLRTQGWQLKVAFFGHHYPVDTPCLERLGFEVSFSLPPRPMPSSFDERAQASRKPGWRQLLRLGWRCMQALPSQVRRARPAWGWFRDLVLRAQALRVQDHADPRHASLLRQALVQWPPDVVLVEYIRLAWVAPLLPQGALRVIDTHDVQHQRQQRFHAAGEPHGLDIGAEEEGRWLSCFDVVVAIQRRDQECLQALLKDRAKPEVVVAMHPLPVLAPVQAPADELLVGFIGSAMAPNVHAARELLQRIWPVLLAQWPAGRAHPRLQIIGSVCDALGDQALPPQVELLGHLESLEPAYAKLSLLVNPIRIGGGLKIKNVDALCRAKALVTTPLGAEGLEDGAGEAFKVEEQAEAIAARVLELLLDQPMRTALEQAAHAYARLHFEERQVYAELIQALERRAAAGRQSA